MKKVLLFGASGNAGRAIAGELKRRNYELTAVIRNSHKMEALSHLGCRGKIADVTDPATLAGICKGSDVVVSALGKSVSLNDRSRTSFHEIDFIANSHILREAVSSGVPKFVYLSAFHADRYPHLAYFKAHADFEEALKKSGLDYSIIRPPAIFCAFVDLVDLAKKGRLMNIGRGDKRTNPIYEGDLARIVVDAIGSRNAVVEAGGKEILTRRQINGIIQEVIAPGKTVKSVPAWPVKAFLPLMRLISRGLHDKLAFYLAVMQHDAIAPQVGSFRLEHYIRSKSGGTRLDH